MSGGKRFPSNGVLALVWAGLVVVALMVRHCGGGGVYDRPEPTGERVFAGLEPEAIALIEIEGPIRSAVLRRRAPKTWVVASQDDYPADPNAMTRVLDEIVSLPRGRVASSDPGPRKLADYGLGPEERVAVRALGKDGEVLAEFAIGKAAEDYRSCFVQLAGESAVRRIYKVIRNAFGQARQATWRDSTILDIEADSIVGFVIEGVHGRIELVKESAPGKVKDPSAQERWRMRVPRDAPADDILISRLETRVSPLLSESWPDKGADPTSWGLDPPQIRVTIQLEGGVTKRLEVGGPAGEGKVYVKTPESSTVFIVPDWRVDDFGRDPAGYLLDEKGG